LTETSRNAVHVASSYEMDRRYWLLTRSTTAFICLAYPKNHLGLKLLQSHARPVLDQNKGCGGIDPYGAGDFQLVQVVQQHKGRVALDYLCCIRP
jgi:hypothetical protein